MEIRYHHSAKETAGMLTHELRQHFLMESVMQPDTIRLLYTHYDRVIIGGVMPVNKKIALPVYDALKANFFLERREIGIINTGGDGEVIVNDKAYALRKLDCLYVGKGNEKVQFKTAKRNNPAKFYLFSAPAHKEYKVQLMKREKASPVDLGAAATANQRTVYKYIHSEGLKSCQVVMGLTVLKEGSVWNTIPTHVHDRRMEAYYYFDLAENQKIIHLMGEPAETRHLVVGNEQAIISPPWSIHSGCGTSNYGFIWGMAGENYVYTDMDVININDLK
ncbi:MAG TPA: 5-dehydro-4-deoxy-D-glucuronate isomerase [Ferruginibacter sp.]|nr:5-dehydro-4-deoxy-D-glucuronate isomerase [Ferruginibacter sp.]HMP20553.1 5-dehydro-4-deoxy-D-glucuronate isomerase [Ferruginibacter sp.]